MTTSDVVRVLLVDDNPDDVSIIHRLLDQYGRASFEVIAASSTVRGLEILEESSADLVILDYAMPNEDGLAFLHRASALRTMPPVVMVTGRGDFRVVAEAIRGGAADCLYKHTLTSQVLGRSLQLALVRSREEAAMAGFDARLVEALVTTSITVNPTHHEERIVIQARRFGQALALNDHQLMLLELGALLHDVGKIGVDRAVLAKPGPLTPTEIEEVRLHPILGERLCASLTRARELGPILRHHHEHWDGTGYVDGLAGEDIPFLARAVSIIDAFDAMISDRPYRAAREPDEALSILLAGAGSQWDPRLVSAYVDLIEEQLGGIEETKRAA